MQSSIPAIWSSFLGTGAETMPVPRGAGISLTQIEPHLPVTLQGTVWGLPILVPQKPLLTGMMESLAMMMAPRMAVATSLEHFSPIATKALNLVLCPALVCFWTGMIFSTSSFRAGPMNMSMISCSLIGREKRYISSKLLILPSFTRRPSLVTGIQSFSSFPLPPRPLPRPLSPLPLPLPRLLLLLLLLLLILLLLLLILLLLILHLLPLLLLLLLILHLLP